MKNQKKMNIFIIVLMQVSILFSACTTVPNVTPIIQSTAVLIQTVTPPPPTLQPLSIDKSLVLAKHPELILATNKPSRKTTYPEKVVYTLPSEDRVQMASELVFYKQLVLDIYYPPDYQFDKKLPVVILAHGFSESSGEYDKDIQQHIDWAKLIAASGMVAVSAQAGLDPYGNQDHVLDYLTVNADQLGIDPYRIGFWICSGQGWPVINDFNYNSRYKDNFKAAVLLYTDINTQMSISWPKHLSLFMVKAGNDPSTNILMDYLAKDAKNNNVPVEFSELPDGVHGFDVLQDTQAVKDIIQRALDFYKNILFKEN